MGLFQDFALLLVTDGRFFAAGVLRKGIVP
jgi:hypothetical protein